MQAVKQMAQVEELVQSKAQAKAEELAADQKVKDIFRSNVAMMMFEVKAAGFTVADLAAWLGYDRQNIYNWRDGTEPSMTTLVRLKRVWGLDFTEPVPAKTFVRMLTGQDKGLYRKRGNLTVVPTAAK